MASMNPWAFEMRNGQSVEKRIYTCRASYTIGDKTVKCQLRGRHKGIHQHTYAQPGAMITVTWHPIVTGNFVKTNKPKSLKRQLMELELEECSTEMLVVA